MFGFSQRVLSGSQLVGIVGLTIAVNLSPLIVQAQTKSAVQWYNDEVDKLAAQDFKWAIADFT